MRYLYFLSIMLYQSSFLFAEDLDEALIFGDKSDTHVKEEKVQEKEELHSLAIGAQLKLEALSRWQESQKVNSTPFYSNKQADMYLDGRPSSDVRGYFGLRLHETGGIFQQSLDELWFRWNLEKIIFFTAGKQHLKWGSGKIWNPSDLLAKQIKNPMDLTDQRLGLDLVKIHIPSESGYNFYLIGDFDDAKTMDDIGGSLRMEMLIGQSTEMAMSFRFGKKKPLTFAMDVSSSLWDFDIYREMTMSYGHDPGSYGPSFREDDPSTWVKEYHHKKLFFQGLVGLAYQGSREERQGSYTIGLEFFYNGRGYKDRKKELFAIIQGDAVPLYAGNQYLGGYIVYLGSKHEFYINGVWNLKDGTKTLRWTWDQKILKDLDLIGYVQSHFGEYGDLALNVPSQYQKFLPDEERSLFPTKPIRLELGLSMSMRI